VPWPERDVHRVAAGVVAGSTNAAPHAQVQSAVPPESATRRSHWLPAGARLATATVWVTRAGSTKFTSGMKQHPIAQPGFRSRL
jgi:hypothetical protein